MPSPVEKILETRQRRLSGGKYGLFAVTSALLHGTLIAVIWLGPKLLAKPPEPLKFMPISVVPPTQLGSEKPPPPPPPPKPEEKPREEVPPPPPPDLEVKKKQQPPPDDDVPVLPQKKKKAAPPPPPEPAKAAPAPTPQRTRDEPAQRRGSATGNPLGTSVHKNRLGIEDPNFTYGYYLDLVVAALRDTWSRPPVGSEFKQAIVHFRVLRDGTVTEVRLMETSGSQVYDRTALRAVENATLPPLPRGYKEDDLGINVIIR